MRSLMWYGNVLIFSFPKQQIQYIIKILSSPTKHEMLTSSVTNNHTVATSYPFMFCVISSKKADINDFCPHKLFDIIMLKLLYLIFVLLTLENMLKINSHGQDSVFHISKSYCKIIRKQTTRQICNSYCVRVQICPDCQRLRQHIRRAQKRV